MGLTEREFGEDGAVRLEVLSLAVVVDGAHAELVLLVLVQTLHVALGFLAEGLDAGPVGLAHFALLDYIMLDAGSAVVLGRLPLEVTSRFVHVRRLQGSRRLAWCGCNK